MAFPDSFLEELTARTDIVDVVSRQVELKKRGDGYWGLCPFHGEKTPSFHVLPDRQIFHCFGCAAGGGVIQFVQRSENLTFADAVLALADRAGLAVPEEGGRGEERDTIYRLNRLAAHWFHSQLSSPAGAQAREYIQGRLLAPRTVVRFGLGWAPDSWHELLEAMRAQGFTQSDVCAAGLAVPGRRDGGAYDRFRGRLIFPIIDMRKRVIAFGGRTLGEATPKYLNSPDTPVFSKSRHLFAMPFAKNAGGQFILTEGYMDVVSLHQAGFAGAVASLGTALTASQALLMTKYAKEVVIAYDMDAAGQNAAHRAIGILEQSGIPVRVLRLAGAKDPDEYIRRHGREAFAAQLSGSPPRAEFLLSALAERFDLTNDEGRLQFCREAAELLARLDSEAERAIYLKQAAALCDIPAEALKADVARARQRLGRQKSRDASRRATAPAQALQPIDRALRYEDTRSASAEEGVIRVMFLDPSQIGEAFGLLAPEDFSSSLLGRLFAWAAAHPDDPGKAFSAQEAFAPEELSHLARIMQKPISYAESARALRDCAAAVQEMSRQRRFGQASDDALMSLRKRKRNDNEQR